jgi:hypothetical protein
MHSIVRFGLAGGLVAATAGLAGCYQTPKARVYSPGVYKGAPDPLLEKLREPQEQQALRERLNVAARDR